MKNRITILIVLLFLSGYVSAALSGTKSVGPGGDYPTLTAAFADITTQTLSGNISLQLLTGYTSSSETFPLNPPTLGTASTTITIYPTVSGLSITSANTTGTIEMNGAKYVTFDGRVNATGSLPDLIVDNTSTAGYTFNFINDASDNTIKYCVIKGVNSGTMSTINFDVGLVTGNDNNTIDNCYIRDGATKPAYPIYGYGTSAAIANSNITISNCRIYNYTSIGIIPDVGCTGWTIQNNSFYQEAAYIPATGTGQFAIILGAGDGYMVSGNYIGGSAPNCGGSPWTLGNTASPTISNFIYAIRVYSSVSTTNPITIQNNTISNITLATTGTGTAGSFVFLGLLVSGGNTIVSGNTIGSISGTNSLQFALGNTTTSSCNFIGCYWTAPSGSFQNNNIGGFTINSAYTGTSAYVGVYGLYFPPGPLSSTFNISGNVIGSNTVANSFQTAGSASYYNMVGIYSIPQSGTAQVNIYNNTIANLSMNAANTSSYLLGIRNAGSVSPTAIYDNTIHDLTSGSTNTGNTNIAAIVGISSSNSKPGQVIRNNNIYNLASTAAAANVTVNGIYVSGTSGSMTCERNFVRGISLATSSTTAGINGLMINAATNTGTYKNNMIQLGYKGDGTALTTGYSITGIYDLTGYNSILFNSVYIGGAASGVTSSTYAFYGGNTSTPHIYENNIFFNDRTGGTTGKHYAVRVAGTGVNPIGLTSNYNVFYAPGGVLGLFNALDVTSLNGWRLAVGQDANSISANPQYILPGGSSSTTNLHISPSLATPVESQGLAIGSVTDDYDAQLRSTLTPTDIGADAGNFVQLDLSGPTIVYSLLTNTSSTANRVLNSFATITDPGLVNFTSGTSPRLYYKKSTDNNTYVGNTSADNGWKYVETSSGSSPASFTIDYSILYSASGPGSVTAGDLIQYFIVAQDLLATPNVSINSGAFTLPPASVALPLSAFPIGGTINSYYIAAAIPATVNVGTGQTYTSLTADASTGLFKAINQSLFNSNVVVNIVSDLTETGAIALNQWTEEGAGNYTLTIQPDATTVRTISGTAVATGVSMINFNGADRVTINGGSGKYLLFRNTNATAANCGSTIQFGNGSTSCVLTQSVIENNSTAAVGSVFIGVGTNSIAISSNDVRDATAGTAGRPAYGIFSNNALNSVSLTDNNVSNFTSYGILMQTVADGCVITGNNIFYNHATVASTAQTAIAVFSNANHTISNNYIGGSAINCGGSSWTNSGAVTVTGISIGQGTGSATSVQGNIIKNFNLTSTSTSAFDGIYATSGTVNIGTVTGNTIGDLSTANIITSVGTSGLWGIYAGTPAVIANNTIANMTNTGTAPSNVYGIRIQYDFPITVEKNKIIAIGATNAAGVSTAPTSAIMVRGSTAGMSNTYMVRNNVVSIGEGVANDILFTGIWDYDNGTKADYYYNSILILGTTTTNTNGGGMAFYKMGTSTLNIKNNILSCNRSGLSNYAIAYLYGSFASDYNDLYNTDPSTIATDGTNDYTFGNWQTASGQDIKSISSNPNFTSTTNLLPQAGSPVIGAALTLPGIVDYDILGVARSTTAPTIGAYEIVTATNKTLNLKVFLEGAYNGTDMNTTLNTILPLTSPYGTGETVGSIPNADIVDWVLVEPRIASAPENATSATKLAGWPKSCFLKKDGSIVDLDGLSLPSVGNPTIIPGNYMYVVVRHRNHLSVMSNFGLSLEVNSFVYDFSTAVTQAYGGASGYKELRLSPGVFGMVDGDADGDLDIGANDFTVWSQNIGLGGYAPTDIDMDADIGANDFTEWSRVIGLNNAGMPAKAHSMNFYKSQVPK